MIKHTASRRLLRLAAAAALLSIAGCERQAGPASASAPASQPSGPVTMKIRPQGQYQLEGASVDAGQLATRLRSRLPAGDQPRTLQLLGYDGVTGYDVAIALEAARQAGFTRVEGIAEYSENAEPARQKRWAQDLSALPASSPMIRDTARRTR